MSKANKESAGRPTVTERHDLLSKIFGIYLARQVKGEPKVDPKEVAAELKIPHARARKYMADLDGVITRFSRGRASSYYWGQLDTHTELKMKVAEKTAELIPKDTSVACSPGTTVAHVFAVLAEKHQYISFITNNCGVMDNASGMRHSTLEFTGGSYDVATHSCLGAETEASFRQANVSRAIVGISGLDLEGNLYVKHKAEVRVLSEILQSANDEIFVVATIDKLSKADSWNIGSIKELSSGKRPRRVRLITNPMADFPTDDTPDTQSRTELATKVFATLSEHVELADSL